MGKEIKVRVVMRHNTTDGWKLIEDTAVLYKGEIGLEFTAGSNVPKIKIGDGRRPWKGLEYFTAALPDKYTWGDLYGTVLENETEYDDSLYIEEEDENGNITTTNLQLKYPGYPETVNIRDINKNFSNLSKKITSDIEVQIKIIKEQISKFLGEWSENQELPESSISKELIDARTRFKGEATYNSLGATIRAIDEDLFYLTEQMSEFIGSSAIDGLYYEGNKLWVASGGLPVGDPVEIVSGGGGGGGGSSSYIISLTNLLDSRILSVAIGEKVILEFNYVSKDSEGYTDGPGIGTISVGGIKRASITVPQGDNTFDVTDYLVAGDNTVKVQVTNSDGSYRSLTYTISVVSLSITTTATDMSLYTGEVSFPYTITGSGAKNVFFIMDGTQIGKETITTSGRSYYFNIPIQQDGGHIFEIYAELTTGTTTIKSNTLRMGMMWYSETMTSTAILINNTISKITQGETLTIPYLVYTPNLSETEIILTILDESGNIYSEKKLTVDGTVKYWNTQDYPVGLTAFRITSGGVSEAIQITVSPSSFTKTIIQEGLLLEFSSYGRDNSEDNPEQWSYDLKDAQGNFIETIEADFNGFGWSNVDGWYKVPLSNIEPIEYQTVLRFLPGNTMTIPYYPFAAQTIKQSGLTIEVEFSTHNVKDSETTILASYKDGKGLLIQASSAKLSASGTSVTARFKEDSKVRVTFVIEPNTVNSFIYIYVNGIMCGISQYKDLDDFTQDNLITIGAETSGLDLYTLRFYRRALSSEEQLNNFIVDRPTLSDRIKVNDRNNIFNEEGDITINTLPMTIPYIIMECEELPQFKGDKKKGKSVTFVDPINTGRSFTAEGCQFDVQGTSSAGYPIKNYKIGLKEGITYTNTNERDSNGFPIFEGGMSGENICLKADFASSENANNVMLVDYYEGITPFATIDGKEVPYPPTIEDSTKPGYIGYIDARCRRAIRGFPCVLFWKNTSTGEIKFIGKYNFNDDKSNENVFGFNRDVNPATECWEFCNNTSDRVIFKATNFFEGEEKATDWLENEIYSKDDIVVYKYPYISLIDNNNIKPGTDSSAWEKIEYDEDVFNDFEPRFPDLDDMYTDLSAFYRMAKWVNSTDTEAEIKEDATLTINGEIFKDTPENRLKKFKEEFENYFVKEATLFYYIFTEVFLMVDNRAKNMFLTTFDGLSWFPIPYDMDTAIGINNEGQLVFGYDLEDTDKSGDADVFNGQYSVLWCNIRDAFADDIRNMYISLRSNNLKPFNYSSIQQKMKKHQETWPEALWNEDSYFKYLQPYLKDNEDYLDMLQGNKASQRDWWLYYAFKYRDSKYRTGEAQSTYITLRLYDNQATSLRIKPYANIWVWAKFGSYERWGRAKKNTYFDLEVPAISFNDTECYLYSADCLSEIGDLSSLKVGYINIAAATKLETLTLGSSADGYRNTSFEGVNVGANELLSLLNIENCIIDYEKFPNSGTVDLSKCHGMETVKAFGSNIKNILISNGGHLRSLQLPATLNGLDIKNQELFESLEIEGTNEIITLNLENTPNLPIENLLLNCPLQRLRLKNINWQVSSATVLNTIYEKLIKKNENGNYIINGYNDAGNQVAGPQVAGRVYIDEIDEATIAKINTTFPELIIVVAGKPKFFIRYINKDNSTLYTYISDANIAAIDPVATGKIDTPTYPDSADTKYKYEGWSYNNGVLGLPTKIDKPQTILVDYEETYRVRFFKDETLSSQYTEIGDQWIPENTAARDPYSENLIDAPTQSPTAQYSWVFKGWRVKNTLQGYIEDLTKISKPMDFYPTYNGVTNIYDVIFSSNGTPLQEPIQVLYGETAVYKGKIEDIPYYEEENVISEAWECTGWDRSLIIEPKEYTSEPIIINAVFTFIGNLNSISWSQIALDAANSKVSKYGIGSTKDIILSIGSKTYTVTMELVAKNYDYLEDSLINSNYNNGKPTAAFTFITKEVAPYTRPMQSQNLTTEDGTISGTAVGGWEKSELRKHCENDIFNSYIENDLKNIIKIIKKKTTTGKVPDNQSEKLNITTENIWVPTATELNLDGPQTVNIFVQGQTMNPDGLSYPWFSNDSSRIRRVNDEPVWYWTSSHGSGLTYRYVHISPSGKGEVQSTNYQASSDLHFPFGFCV